MILSKLWLGKTALNAVCNGATSRISSYNSRPLKHLVHIWLLFMEVWVVY